MKPWSLFVAFALVGACTFGSSGSDETGASIGGSEAEGDDDGSAMSSAPGDDGQDDASAGASSGTVTATSGPPAGDSETGEPVDPDGPMSSSGDDPSTSGGPFDPTTDTGTSDDGEQPGPGYPACPSGQDSECGDGNNCVPVLDQWNNIDATVCGEGGCSTGADCDQPAQGNAVPVCVDELSIDTCMLNCQGGATCPTGMECASTDIGSVCVWD